MQEQIQENLKLDIQKYINKFKPVLVSVSINKIVPNSYNPNQHTELSRLTLSNSIKQFGFTDPLSVRTPLITDNEIDLRYEIIDGQHRFEEAKKIGFAELPVINFGEITEEEAMTLTQLLNLRGKDDIIKRAKLLKQLESQKSLFDLLPGTEKDKSEELKLLDFDFSQFESLEPEKEQKTDDYEQAIKKATELEIILKRVHRDTTNHLLKSSIEVFYDFIRMLKSYIPD